MKKAIHPKKQIVAFKDITSGNVFLIKSTLQTKEKITHEGKEYPLFNVDTSSASHPIYTGNRAINKLTGRVERFKRMAAAKK